MIDIFYRLIDFITIKFKRLDRKILENINNTNEIVNSLLDTNLVKLDNEDLTLLESISVQNLGISLFFSEKNIIFKKMQINTTVIEDYNSNHNISSSVKDIYLQDIIMSHLKTFELLNTTKFVEF